MAEIYTFELGGCSNELRSIRELRKEMGLSLSQAAAAMGVSAATIENWEANPGMGPGPDIVTDKLQSFIRENGTDAGKNLVFGHYPLRVARELLGMSVAEIAKAYGFSPSAWQKLESNGRALSKERLSVIEEDVRNHFERICAAV